MHEAEIQRRFIAAANHKRGAFARKVVSVGQRGLPDTIYICDGYVTFIEFKALSGELTPIQEICHSFLEEAGARVLTLFGWEQTQEFMRREKIKL